jgi:galactokinase
LAANAPASLNPDLKEAARILGVVRTTLADDLLGQGATRIELDPGCQLKILKRARHVLRETERVLSAVVALETGDLREMGELMNQSHRSLAEDFACSTARLDAMVECARRGGALGARLTGAGFGGSIVALCEAGAAHSVIDALDRDYYAKLALDQPLENCRAVLHAGDGAQMIELAAA